MTSNLNNHKKVTAIGVYSAYPWDNALLKLRILNQASAAGINIVQGNDYLTGQSNIDLVKDVDAVFIQRDYPRYIEDYRLLKEACARYAKPIMYDIDDLLFGDGGFPTNDEADYYRPAIGQILDAILNANLVTTSSEGLKTSLEKFAKNVRVVKNYLDERQWTFSQPVVRHGGPLIVGYVGTRSHLKDLEQLYPAFQEVIQRCGDAVSFHLWIESLPVELARMPQVVWKPFSLPQYDSYIRWISAVPVDVWIAPLNNTHFNQVKSPIKFLEYSTRAVPGVYSRVAPYQDVITDGLDGYLAGDPAEWAEKLVVLLSDDELRLKMGAAAQETVRQNWLLASNLGPWEKVLDNLAGWSAEPAGQDDCTRRAFELLSLHYANATRSLLELKGELNRYKWLAADRDDVMLRYEKLSQSFFVRLRNKFRNLQNRYFSASSLQGKLLGQGIQTVLKIINRPAPPPALPLSEAAPETAKVPAEVAVSDPIRLALYTTDNWDTASAHIRLVGPSNYLHSGIKILNGCQVTSSASPEFFSNADAVVIQRDFPRHEQLYHSVMQWARQNRKKVFYEIDDLLYGLPEEHPEKAYFRGCEDLIKQAIASADAVVATTHPLMEKNRELNPNSWLLPNYLDDNIWPLARPDGQKANSRIVLGYMAGISQSHIPDLDKIMDLLLRLLEEYPDKLCLNFWGGVGDDRKQDPAIVYHKVRFTNYKEFAAYFSTQKVDVFVAPLVENVFNSCKSAIKFLEYSSLGVPGVYSAIKPYQHVINQGQNGFLASGLQEWEEYIRLLIRDDSLRQSMGDAALASVKSQHLMSRHAVEWKALYSHLIRNS